MENITPIERRFWSRVKKENEMECWMWLGDCGANGYGRMQFNGKRLLAHRLSYMLNVGHIDTGLVVHHKCGQKTCVNPLHLSAITSVENTRAHYNGY